ncbi:hypothetical protein GCM10009655_22600 [Rhodoglobus aureus]|uniref:Uncharacterized protein n=1 Tax=Rhodoglobus aureus TaxID=191497 RepID=A0ABN1VTI1_9MICO
MLLQDDNIDSGTGKDEPRHDSCWAAARNAHGGVEFFVHETLRPSASTVLLRIVQERGPGQKKQQAAPRATR